MEQRGPCIYLFSFLRVYLYLSTYFQPVSSLHGIFPVLQIQPQDLSSLQLAGVEVGSTLFSFMPLYGSTEKSSVRLSCKIEVLTRIFLSKDPLWKGTAVEFSMAGTASYYPCSFFSRVFLHLICSTKTARDKKKKQPGTHTEKQR